LIVARNLYQETTGLAQLAGMQSGTHFLALIPANSALFAANDVKDREPAEGILIVLQGGVRLRQSAAELLVSAGEVASWDAAHRYSIENHGTSPARALMFILENLPLPALTRLPGPYASTAAEAYATLPQGPMRLVEMRARRQAERRR
jgi:hypothetical protein